MLVLYNEMYCNEWCVNIFNSIWILFVLIIYLGLEMKEKIFEKICFGF